MAMKNASGKQTKPPRAKLALAGFVFLVIAFIAFTLPDHPGAFSTNAFFRLPLEIPLAALLLLLLPRRIATVFAAAFALVVFTLIFLKGADIGVQSAFQRRFNPYLDMKMLADGWNLLSGTIGTGIAAAAIGLGAALLCGLVAAFCWAELQIIKTGGGAKRGAYLVSISILLVGIALYSSKAAAQAFNVRASVNAVSYLGNRLATVQRSIRDMRAFEKALATPDPAQARNDLFGHIKGRDVILIFVESYGRSAVEDPRYSPLIKPRLEALQQELSDAGFSTASSWLHSPTMGGLSWLAHGTFLSGLWVDSQSRYDRLMISERPSLNTLFRKAGWKTAAIMPAITLDWPEAEYFGYDQTLVAKSLEYKGKPFNWVTMPDQYTLSAFERLSRNKSGADGKPVMAEIALISSHAPWTPVPELIDWEDVGDGTAFNEQAQSGKTPREVWSNGDSIREHYIRTIDYSLETLGDYVARFGDDGIFIILGDHQPAPIVTGPDASRAVPVHIISKDTSLIERFQTEGFAEGMTPSPKLPEMPMDTMRETLIRIFSEH